ncbi:choice-of-anchor U domain-containing protein [Thermus scotoductus]|uniref:choice-of-anchor U domain-containing protein n=1 Tax=Thermus scotoductus TaxID=37636 RepID=UPI00057022A9|nr:choice-of-anchor U domain-containing protein [Thermus scotoductus]
MQVNLQGGTFTQGPTAQNVPPPQGFQAPYGAIAFTAQVPQGGTLTVTLTFPSPIPQGAVLKKYQGNAWQDVPGAQLSGNTATYQVQDGGPLDGDGQQNGQVVDPVALLTPAPSYTLSDPSPNPVSVTQGSTATFQVTLTSQNGFQGEVPLSLADGQDPVPQGLSIASTDPSPISLFPNASVQVTVTLSADAQLAPGTYRLKVRAQGGSVTQEKPLTVNVQPPAGSGPSLTWTPVFPAYEVAYGNGVFVAVGEALLVSSDGQNWEAVRPPAPGLGSLSFANGRFLAVEGPGSGWPPSFTIWESTDGRNWTPHPFTPNPATPSPQSLTRIVYKDGAYYVMAGVSGWVTNEGATYAGRLFTSQDLTHWSQVGDTNGLDQRTVGFMPNDLAYGAGHFVAVGQDPPILNGVGVVLVSQDGQTWTRAAQGGIELDSVAFGNGRFVAVGYVYGSPGLALASAPNDPTSWSGLTPPNTTSDPVIYTNVAAINVTFDGTRFLSVPHTSGGRIWAYDGTTADPNSASLPPRVGGGWIAYGGGRYVVMGAGFASSQDLVNWTTGFETNFPLAVAYGNGRFVFSVAGTVLATAPEGPFPAWQVSDPTAGVYRLAYLNGRFLGVGESGHVYLSQDGTSWTQVNTPTSQSLEAVAYGNGTYVAVGLYGAIVHSQDASTWSLAQNTGSRSFFGVAYGNGTFVAVGNRVYTSSDGASWTQQSFTGFMADVAFGNGTFVAVADNYIYRSQDGVTWETITPPPSPLGPNVGRTLRRVVWTGSFFVAVGSTGSQKLAYVVTSADGLHWTLQDTPFDVYLTDVAVGSQYLVAIGEYGVAVAPLP